ncbi:hypothetical protein Pla110_46160 [Polystyrenella longa]|uniref:Uncharacterized protein n=1 Tax=Polystyrenella longa TaxID=2528007 RepID=A0A518CUE5_9PLAN|nr:hypothetical protein [Polystyrenella longa]QDU82853.1 hypothetical protein Pla110_46160 [Polystyrenella longa]
MRLRGIQFPVSTIRVLCVWIFISATALACSVPVFRYALEQWSSDQYEILVFHKTPLDENSQALVKPYLSESAEDSATASANVNVRLIDLNEDLSEEDQLVWETQQEKNGDGTLPWMAVRYPKNASGFKGHPAYMDAWSAAWSEDNFSKTIDSPARREIARRLIKGETAVWVLLRCGDKELDDAAREALAAALTEANETLKLPEIEEQDIADGLVKIDPALLKVNFTTYELDQNNQDEAAFISMLLGSEEDLWSLKDQPMAFPLFGRGRVLYALIGQGINKDVLIGSCTELIGPCTCQVKEENPGTDVVMNVDWNNLIESTIDIDTELPPLTGLASFSEPEAQADGEPVQSDREKLAELQKAAGLEEEPAEEPASAQASVTGSAASPPVDSEQSVTSAAGTTGEMAPDTLIEIGEVSDPQPVEDENSFMKSILSMVGVGVLLLVIGTFFVMRKTGPDA